MFQIIYSGGLWYPWKKIDSNLALWRADGAVEVLEAYDGILFHFDEHFERLIHSCAGYKDLDMNLLPSKEEILLRTIELLEKSSYKNAIVHILATPGNSRDLKKSNGKPELVIDVRELEHLQVNSLKLVTVSAVRYYPDCKLTAGYGYARRFLAEAEEKGFDGIIYHNNETGLNEGAYQNIFFVRKDGILITPKIGVLHGVTRGIVLEIAQKSGIFKDVAEDSVWFWQLGNFSEAFLTSTTLGVAPIAEITSNISKTKKSFKDSPDNTYTLALKEKFLNYRKEYFKTREA